MRRLLPTTLGLLLVAPLVAAGSGSPALAAPAPAVASADSSCPGPGRLMLDVSAPEADGSVELTLTATGLEAGSRWRVSLQAQGRDVDNPDDSESVEFRRRAVDGGWRARGVLVPDEGDGPFVSYDGYAFSPGGRLCSVSLYDGRSTFGAGSCGRDLFGLLVAHERDDGTLRLRMLADMARPGSRWTVELSAIGDGSAQGVTVRVPAGPRGLVRASATLNGGVEDPRFRGVAVGPGGRRCALGLDPTSVSDERFPTGRERRRLGQARVGAGAA